MNDKYEYWNCATSKYTCCNRHQMWSTKFVVFSMVSNVAQWYQIPLNCLKNFHFSFVVKIQKSATFSVFLSLLLETIPKMFSSSMPVHKQHLNHVLKLLKLCPMNKSHDVIVEFVFFSSFSLFLYSIFLSYTVRKKKIRKCLLLISNMGWN